MQKYLVSVTWGAPSKVIQIRVSNLWQLDNCLNIYIILLCLPTNGKFMTASISSNFFIGILVPDHLFNAGIRIYPVLIQSLRANRIIISASTIVWPDLGKFCHFGKILSHWAICWMVDLVFGKLLYLLWHFYATAGQIVTAAMAEDWKIIKASGHTDLR